MRDRDSHIRAELILHFRLKDDAIERIDETMTATGLRFSDAGITLGLLTRTEIDEVLSEQTRHAIAVATMTGRVPLPSRAQHTSFNSAREIMRRLATTQCRIVGAALKQF